MSEVPFSPLDFPTSDGMPMGETGTHAEAIIDLLAQLRQRYHDRDDVYIGADQFLYWEPSDPREVVRPDIYLAFDRPRQPLRDTWKVWEEGKAPDLVVEVTSRSSRVTDQAAKPAVYAALGVRELVLFDPRGEWLQPRLQGFRLQDGQMRPIPASPAGVHLDTVGVWLRAEGERVQAWSEQGERLPSPWRDYPRVAAEREEAIALAEAASARADSLAAERDALLAELAALRAATERRD